MCGIAGFSGRFPQELAGRMADVIAHRGPDDVGHLFVPDAGVALAHRRLAIIDLSPLGHQPMWDVTGRAAIIFNGELFNYRELRAELEADGFAFASASDTEVMLNLYLRDGTDMLRRLNGMYAFALWDARDRSLFLARDGLGVKPLYWSQTPRGFLFASELKALLCAEDVARDIDLRAVQSYLAYLWCPAPDTMLESVKKLPPGHAMIVRDGRVERSFAWYEAPWGPAREIGEEEAAARVHDAVATAVRRQMVADVPVGAFLSGGLDSSSVVAFASREAGYPMECFTIAFRGDGLRAEGFAEDLAYARRVAGRFGVRLNEVEVGHEMAGELETMLWHMDEPQADPAPINALLICRAARAAGLKVLLSGAGGDDIFTGYRRHHLLSRERLWTWLPRGARAAAAWFGASVPAGTPVGRRVQKGLRYVGLDGDERLVSYFYWLPPDRIARLRGPRLRGALDGTSPAAPLLATLRGLPAEATPLQRMLQLEVKHFLADHNLIYGDKMSMASGVEVRVPLLDPDLVALAASLPDRLKQRDAVGKWIFKKAMERELPHDVIYRPKTGFGAPLRRWVKHELAPLLDDTLSDRSIASRGLFDPAAVAELRRDDAEGRIDGAYPLFTLACIEIWCRLFLKAPVSEAAPA